ncbi:FecR domain-containing protein [Chitinophaga sp. OAE865]|uniref:FecR family protein n=1 Tax=Chitinophaga sp. OAE865 TaxID=2817898 RepID=UPI001AE77556
MSVSPELLKKLLRKQKEKTITEREMVLLQLYLSTSGAEAALDAIDFSDMPESDGQPGASPEERYQRILQKTVFARERRFPWPGWAAAAAVLLIIGALFFLRDPAPAKLLTWRTGNGELKEIMLPDSSRIWLDARSVLSYPAASDRKERRIVLQEGQAFFDVTPDTRRPFIVENKQGIQTRVLGTSFAVRADSSIARIYVAVKSGKVSVNWQDKEIATLLPGEQLSYDPSEPAAQLSRMDAAVIGEWTGGEVRLAQADFATMAAAMQRMYGIVITAANAGVSRNLYSLTIRYGKNPQKLVEVISAVNGNRCEWNNRDSTSVIIH